MPLATFVEMLAALVTTLRREKGGDPFGDRDKAEPLAVQATYGEAKLPNRSEGDCVEDS